MRCYDRQGALRLELGFETTPGHDVQYRERGGVELVERLRVLAVAQRETQQDRPVWFPSR